jgi:hypothetical protein
MKVFLSLRHLVQTGCGPLSPASYPVVTGGFSLGIKCPEHEADHLPPSRVVAENACSYTSTPPYVFTACHLDKHRDLTFLLQKY